MPVGVPTPQQLLNESISFFSLDTDPIQAKGYRFSAAPLSLLPEILPDTLSLKLSEIVVSEVVAHQVKPVQESVEQFQKAAKHLNRHIPNELQPVLTGLDAMVAIPAAVAKFKQEIHTYVWQCRGEILGYENVESGELFDLYFGAKPPFGEAEKRKSEFPDAAALLTLEHYAKANDTKGLVVSKDGGWKAFCDNSDHLYCLDKIEDLTELFEATGEAAAEAKQMIEVFVRDQLANDDSPLHEKIEAKLSVHYEDQWDLDTSDFYSNSGLEFESEVDSVELDSYSLVPDSLNLWMKEEDNTWVAQFKVIVDLNVTVTSSFTAWDSVDRESVGMGSTSQAIYVTTAANIYMRFGPGGNLEDQDDIEISSEHIELPATEVKTPW